MKITIDDKYIDIVFENEKTLGEVFSGIEKWLSTAGLSISNVEVDGDTSCTADMQNLFDKDIDSVHELKIKTSLVSSLHLEALRQAIETLDLIKTSDDGKKKIFIDSWITSCGASFIKENDNNCFKLILNAFNNNDTKLRQNLVERSLEIENMIKHPAAEFANMEKNIGEVTQSLQDLPLDLQTGKDAKACAAIEKFTSFTNKMFYLINIIFIDVEKRKRANIETKLEEFNGTLKEFLSAYENKDLVLSGDLAEYEIAPRLQVIYDIVKEHLAGDSDI
ncbi:MAG: hypothetical protein Ta2B_18990 [Termitinemataceae bacterium]|nr:MAG: hypothetical protein Ta2B_18990 [Termitinemataceae bacterium]